MANDTAPACPRCGSACIAAYGQWYCEKCRIYPFLPPPEDTVEDFGRALEDLAESIGRGVDGFIKSASKHSCPTCKGDLEWIEEYKRWYCRRCQKYA